MESSVQIVPPGQMAYGMQLPIQSKSRSFAQEWEQGAGVNELVSIAKTADRLGFFYIGVCDHVAIPADRASTMGTTWYDTIATLGMLAGLTDRVRLLSHVWILAYRHPLQSANAFATLDHLSRGRVIVGVGAGHLADEFAALGIDFERRGHLTDEAMGPFMASLTDEFVDGMGIAPRPVQKPRPPDMDRRLIAPRPPSCRALGRWMDPAGDAPVSHARVHRLRRRATKGIARR